MQLSKAEKRLLRAAAKHDIRAEKSARLRERPTGDEVRLGDEPPQKSPRLGADPGSIFDLKVTWSVDKADCKDCWSWGTDRQWSLEDWTGLIEPKLFEFSALTWKEIDAFTSGTGHKMHHNMEVHQLAEEAQYRLVEIEQFADTMFRFRLGSKPRLWGFRVLGHFEVVWYDPEHAIYPVDH